MSVYVPKPNKDCPCEDGKCVDCALTFLDANIRKLESENARLKEQIVQLSGETHCCMQCEGYAKEISRLKAALDYVVNSGESYERVQQIAEQALSPQEGGGK